MQNIVILAGNIGHHRCPFEEEGGGLVFDG